MSRAPQRLSLVSMLHRCRRLSSAQFRRPPRRSCRSCNRLRLPLLGSNVILMAGIPVGLDLRHRNSLALGWLRMAHRLQAAVDSSAATLVAASFTHRQMRSASTAASAISIGCEDWISSLRTNGKCPNLLFTAGGAGLRTPHERVRLQTRCMHESFFAGARKRRRPRLMQWVGVFQSSLDLGGFLGRSHTLRRDVHQLHD